MPHHLRWFRCRAVCRALRISILAMIFVHAAFSSPVSAVSAQADATPWSGWWWPLTEGGMATGEGYRGRPAPLEKYLMLTEGTTRGPLITWYLDRYYDPDALGWEGLCPYFARAAVMEAYEILPSSEENLVVRVGDKKALLTLCHDHVLAQKAESGRDPANLHRWLLEYIGQQKRSFIADLVPTEEVWFFPIYAYDMQTQRVTAMTESVTTAIFYADDNVHPDYMGTRERKKTYTYTLSLDAAGNITGGWWTGRSETDHPAILILPISTTAKNPYLDCTEVRRMAQSADDFLELPDNDPVSLDPGTYNLVLLDEDQYRIDGMAGDEFLMTIKKQDGSKEDMRVVVKDLSHQIVTSETIPGSSSMIHRVVMQDPPYFISLTQENYRQDPNIYTLTIDVSAPWRRPVPYIPKGGQWSGFALSNAGEETAEEVRLVTGQNDGSPLHTVFGPLDLLPGEKRSFFFDELSWRTHEYSATSSVTLISRHPVEMVNQFAFDEQAMAGFGGAPAVTDRLIIPDIYHEIMGGERYMRGAIKNESFFSSDLLVRLYTAAGILQNEISDQIPAGGELAIRPGTAPFYSAPDNGWMEIVSISRRPVSGYQYIENRSGSRNTMESMFALPVTAGRKIVPHVPAPTGRWRTSVTLVNPDDRYNPVTIHPALAGSDDRWDMVIDLDPFEKRTIDVSDFGKIMGDPLYRSFLEITAEYPLAGYYMYSPPNGGDEAAYPLMTDDDFKNELVLAHHAHEGGRWWTGVGLLNPNAYPVEITMTPHDGSGELAADPQTLVLSPGAYEVFTVRDRFEMAAADIAFMTFSPTDPVGASIGGFYLYGNTGNRQIGNMKSLSGANM